MLQRMREDADETGIVRRLPGAIRFVLLATQEGSLRGSRAAIRLDPARGRALRRDQRAGPQADLSRPQNRVGHFQRDAANVFIGEEILANELKVVQGAGASKKKGSLRQPAKKR